MDWKFYTLLMTTIGLAWRLYCISKSRKQTPYFAGQKTRCINVLCIDFYELCCFCKKNRNLEKDIKELRDQLQIKGNEVLEKNDKIKDMEKDKKNLNGQISELTDKISEYKLLNEKSRTGKKKSLN